MKRIIIIIAVITTFLIPAQALAVEATVSNALAKPASPFSVTISANGIPVGTISMDLWLVYDQNLLQVQGAQASSLTASWSFTANTSQAGIVKIALFNINPLNVTGGNLVTVNFIVADSAALGASCALHLDRATFNNATATVSDGTFSVPIAYTLNTIATNGSINKSPERVTYAVDSVVTLTAAANSGYIFTTWSDDLSGSTNPVTITMNSDKTVTANFSVRAGYASNTAANTPVSTSPASSGGMIYGSLVLPLETTNAPAIIPQQQNKFISGTSTTAAVSPPVISSPLNTTPLAAVTPEADKQYGHKKEIAKEVSAPKSANPTEQESITQEPAAKITVKYIWNLFPLKIIQFYGQKSYSLNGKIVSYLWNFGDGMVSTEMNPLRFYWDLNINNSKGYKVTLMVEDNEGMTATAKYDIK